jgi:nicotinate phosphoribosyltransferase
VDAVPEGTVMVGQGPVIRVSGPLIQCQIVETAILNIMNSNSIVATRAARVSSFLEEHNAASTDFSLRRSPSLDLNVGRSSYIGGFVSTSNVHAGKELGIPVTGTMAHSFVTSFQKEGLSNSDVERKAFKEYLKKMPGNSVLLIDTFDTKKGIVNAIEVAEELGVPLMGVRLDSGDLYKLSWLCHEQLEAARQRRPELFNKTNIFLTDGLDEEKLVELFERSMADKGKEFPAKSYGVGTKLGNPGPLNGGVYKLSAFRADPNKPTVGTMKIGESKAAGSNIVGEKTSLPGESLNTLRLLDADGTIVAEVVVNGESDITTVLSDKKAIRVNGDKEGPETLPEYKTSALLLKPVFRRKNTNEASELVYGKEKNSTLSLADMRKYAQTQIKALPKMVRNLKSPDKVPLFVSASIYAKMKEIIEKNGITQEPKE